MVLFDWTKVEDGLPSWDTQCLVVDGKGRYGVGYYRKDIDAWDSPIWGFLETADKVDNHEAYECPCGMYKVVAWTPLPEYKRE